MGAGRLHQSVRPGFRVRGRCRRRAGAGRRTRGLAAGAAASVHVGRCRGFDDTALSITGGAGILSSMRNVLLWAATLGIVALGWLFLIVGGAAVQVGAEAMVGWFGHFGTWGHVAFLTLLFGSLWLGARAIDRRDERRRYASTKTIDGTATSTTQR